MHWNAYTCNFISSRSEATATQKLYIRFATNFVATERNKTSPLNEQEQNKQKKRKHIK